MPGGDRTGPLGQGPRTGRAAGYCAGYAQPGSMTGGLGGGRGFGGGRGRRGGWRNWFYATGLTGWQRAGQAATQAVQPQPVPPQATAPVPPTEPTQSTNPSTIVEIQALRAQLENAESMIEELRHRLDAQEDQPSEG